MAKREKPKLITVKTFEADRELLNRLAIKYTNGNISKFIREVAIDKRLLKTNRARIRHAA